MTNDNDYDYTEEDLKQTGGGFAPLPIGEYDFEIEKAEVNTSKKTGKLFLKLQLRIPDDGRPYAKRVVFDGYLPLAKGKDGKPDKRATSFFGAVGIKAGQRPPGAPGGPDVETLVGQIVSNRISHNYQDGAFNASGKYVAKLDDNDYPVRVPSWSKEGKELLAKTVAAVKKQDSSLSDADAKIEALKAMKTEPASGFYSMSDSWEAPEVGEPEAADEEWG